MMTSQSHAGVQVHERPRAGRTPCTGGRVPTDPKKDAGRASSRSAGRRAS
jgi:hypothetical protein